MADLDVGDVAPDFTLPADGGSSLKLSSFVGKPVVLYFYPEDDTPSCTNEAISFSQLKSDFEKAGAVIESALNKTLQDVKGELTA